MYLTDSIFLILQPEWKEKFQNWTEIIEAIISDKKHDHDLDRILEEAVDLKKNYGSGRIFWKHVDEERLQELKENYRETSDEFKNSWDYHIKDIKSRNGKLLKNMSHYRLSKSPDRKKKYKALYLALIIKSIYQKLDFENRYVHNVMIYENIV